MVSGWLVAAFLDCGAASGDALLLSACRWLLPVLPTTDWLTALPLPAWGCMRLPAPWCPSSSRCRSSTGRGRAVRSRICKPAAADARRRHRDDTRGAGRRREPRNTAVVFGYTASLRPKQERVGRVTSGRRRAAVYGGEASEMIAASTGTPWWLNCRTAIRHQPFPSNTQCPPQPPEVEGDPQRSPCR